MATFIACLGQQLAPDGSETWAQKTHLGQLGNIISGWHIQVMAIWIYIYIYNYIPIYIWDDELHFCLASLVWNRPSRRPVILLLQAKCGKITGRNRVTGGFKYVSLSTWFGMMIPALRRHQTFIKDPKFHGHFPGNRGFTTGFFMWTSLNSRMFHHTKRVACVAFPGATDAGEPNGTCCATPQVTWPWQRACAEIPSGLRLTMGGKGKTHEKTYHSFFEKPFFVIQIQVESFLTCSRLSVRSDSQRIHCAGFSWSLFNPFCHHFFYRQQADIPRSNMESQGIFYSGK